MFLLYLWLTTCCHFTVYWRALGWILSGQLYRLGDDSVGLTLPLHISGWRSQKKWRSKNKTWLWTRPQQQKERRALCRLFRLSPNRQHRPLEALFRHSDTLLLPLINDALTGQKANMFSLIAAAAGRTFYKQRGKDIDWTRDKSPAALNI